MSRVLRKALALLPDTGTIAVVGPRRTRLVRTLRGGACRVELVGDPSKPWPSCDAALLVDALAPRAPAAQEAMLAEALVATRAGGPVVIVEVDGARRIRAALARLRARLRGQRPGAGRARTTKAYAVLLREAAAEDVQVVVPSRRLLGRGRSVVLAVATGHTRRPARPRAPGRTSSDPGSRCASCLGVRRRAFLAVPPHRLVRCRDCGLVSNDPLPSEAQALTLYDAAYFRGDSGYRDYVAEEATFRAVFRRRLVRLRAAGARPGQRLLDVGAATGAFLREARAAGFVVAGVEPAEAVAAHARTFGLSVRTGTIGSMDGTDGVFDVVTCFDVVEHLVDPIEGLATLARHARPGGIVAVTVPNFGGYWARACGRFWPLLSPHEHLHHFTRRSLRAALVRVGLSVTSLSTVATPVSLGTALRETLGPLGARAGSLLARLADRGLPLPFGTLLAIARAR